MSNYFNISQIRGIEDLLHIRQGENPPCCDGQGVCVIYFQDIPRHLEGVPPGTVMGIELVNDFSEIPDINAAYRIAYAPVTDDFTEDDAIYFRERTYDLIRSYAENARESHNTDRPVR